MAAKIAILHPDLGIGGAERLIVDVAVALKQSGHAVHILTAHHDQNHCFEETRNGTLDVRCVGDWLPRSLFGKCYAACAYLRMIYVALYLLFFSSLQYDIVICDLISACIPFLKLFSRAKVLFYCHFPDQLLTERQTTTKRIYRVPLDWFEEKTTGMADTVLVNSNFTGEIFRSTFKSLSHVTPVVLYPSQQMLAPDSEPETCEIQGLSINEKKIKWLFLSINRYERKKNVALALEAIGILLNKIESEKKNAIHLIIAGGYDSRVTENIEYHNELLQIAEKLNLMEHITFLRSCSDAEKHCLLQRCTCLIYTPDREHFGIVPIEAMSVGTPVIAVCSGGPKETIVDGKTGFLCEPNKQSFADAMEKFVNDSSLATIMGKAGKQHTKNNFSFEAFCKNLNTIMQDLMADQEHTTCANLKTK